MHSLAKTANCTDSFRIQEQIHFGREYCFLEKLNNHSTSSIYVALNNIYGAHLV